jgi:nitrate reductase NapA
MVVTNPEASAKTRADLAAAPGTIPDKPGFHAVLQNRMLKDGKLNAYWVQVNNNMQAAANMMQEGYPATATRPTSSSCPSLSDRHALAPDLMLPTRCGSRRRAPTATPSGARSSGTSWSTPPGEARSDLWQLMEFSKRFKIEEVWPSELIAKKPEYRGKTMYDVLFRTARSTSFPLSRGRGRLRERRVEGLRLLLQKGLFEEYAEFGRGHGHDLRRSTLPRGARPALAGGRRQGNAVALPRRQRSLRQGRHGLPVLRQPRRQGVILARCPTSLRRGAGYGIPILAVYRGGKCSSTWPLRAR